MPAQVPQQDNILGDRECPVPACHRHCSSETHEKPSKQEPRAEEGVDCDLVSEEASHTGAIRKAHDLSGRSCPAAPRRSSGGRAAKRRDRWTRGSEIGDCRELASEHRNSSNTMCVSPQTILQEPRSKKLALLSLVNTGSDARRADL